MLNIQNSPQILQVIPGHSRYFYGISYNEIPINLHIYKQTPWSCKTVWFHNTASADGTVPNVDDYNTIRRAVELLRNNGNALFWLQPIDDMKYSYQVFDKYHGKTIHFKVINRGVDDKYTGEMKKLLAFIVNGRCPESLKY